MKQKLTFRKQFYKAKSTFYEVKLKILLHKTHILLHKRSSFQKYLHFATKEGHCTPYNADFGKYKSDFVT